MHMPPADEAERPQQQQQQQSKLDLTGKYRNIGISAVNAVSLFKGRKPAKIDRQMLKFEDRDDG